MHNTTAVGAKTKKKTKAMKKIKNPFASLSARKNNNNNSSVWLHVPGSPASTKATVELELDDEKNNSSTHWELLEHWSVVASPSASARNDHKRRTMSVASLAFIDNDLSDWMELEADGTASPRRGNSSHHRRNEFCTYYNNNGDDNSDNESVVSSVSAMTMNSGTMERGRRTIDSNALDAIYDEIALEEDNNNTSVKTTHYDEDSIHGIENTCLGIPLMDHNNNKITSSSRSIESTHEKRPDSMVRVVRTAVRRSMRNVLLASDHKRRHPQWTPLSSSQSTYSDCTW